MNPFRDDAQTMTVSGWVALDNVDDLERRVKKLMEGRRFTKVCAYEYAGFRPEVKTGQRAESIKVWRHEEHGSAAVQIVDNDSVWSLDTTLETQPKGLMRTREEHDKLLRESSYVTISDKHMEVELRTPEGRRAWWSIRVEEYDTDDVETILNSARAMGFKSQDLDDQGVYEVMGHANGWERYREASRG